MGIENNNNQKKEMNDSKETGHLVQISSSISCLSSLKTMIEKNEESSKHENTPNLCFSFDANHNNNNNMNNNINNVNNNLNMNQSTKDLNQFITSLHSTPISVSLNKDFLNQERNQHNIIKKKKTPKHYKNEKRNSEFIYSLHSSLFSFISESKIMNNNNININNKQRNAPII